MLASSGGGPLSSAYTYTLKQRGTHGRNLEAYVRGRRSFRRPGAPNQDKIGAGSRYAARLLLHDGRPEWKCIVTRNKHLSCRWQCGGRHGQGTEPVNAVLLLPAAQSKPSCVTGARRSES